MSASFARRRLGVLGAVLLGALVLSIALGLDARSRVAEGRAVTEASARVVRATGLPELVLSTTSSWLRHPALSPPSAGAADAPVGLDVDPAGASVPRRSREPALHVERAP